MRFAPHFSAWGFRRRRFLEAHPDVHAVLLSSDMKTALVSDAIKDRVRVTDPEIVVKIIKH